MKLKAGLFILLFPFGLLAAKPAEPTKQEAKADAKATAKKNIKYTSTSESFDSQLVEGQIYRPDLSVVTGDTEADSFGVVRLRKNFEDHAKYDDQIQINSEVVK